MADNSAQQEQLLELLVTLKKTTPEAARLILNGQPAIAYALIPMMVEMEAINIEVFQKTLAEFGASAATGATALPPAAIAPPPVAPLAAIPPHMQAPAASYRQPTPPTHVPQHTPTPPYGGQYPTTNGQHGYGYNGNYPPQAAPLAPPPSYPPTSSYTAGMSTPTPQALPPASTLAPALPPALANISEEQKAMIVKVLSMTPEQINMLPPHERSMYVQIRASLGIPTG